MLKSWQDVVTSPQIVAEKGGGGGGPRDPDPNGHTTYHLAVQTEVFEPMLQELAELEDNLAGAQSDAVAEYRTEITRFAKATADRVASAG